MIKIILILAFIVCYSDNKMAGAIKISYDMNKTNIDEASFFISKSIKSGSIISTYRLSIKNTEDKFILNKANLSFKNHLGKLIIGKSKNRNNIAYELVNKFELIKEYNFFTKDLEVEAISYISPKIYNNITEFDYSKKNKLKVFRSIWIKNNLKTSLFYIFKQENEILGIGLDKNTQVVNLAYNYEYIENIKTTHSVGLIYKLGNYHYKSLYIFDNLNKEVFISGLDIFLLQNEDDEAKIYIESSYGDERDISKIGASFSF